MDILYYTRDKIHKGSILISHPLMGSVKPNETPYRTVIIDNIEGPLNIESLLIIEDSIKVGEKFLLGKKLPTFSGKVLNDLQTIDYRLIESAISNLNIS